MKKEIIKKFIYSTGIYKNYKFNIGKYEIPKYFNYGNQIGIKNIEENRNLILKQTSKWAPVFEEDYINMQNSLKTQYLKEMSQYYKEMTFFITNLDLWKNLCIIYKVEPEKRNIRTFVVDYYLYNLNLIIEIDSGIHDSYKNYDRARDEYILREYGTDTFRIYKYSETKKSRSEYFNKLIDIMNKRLEIRENIGITGPVMFDFSDIITESFITINYRIINIINYLENKYFSSIALRSDTEYPNQTTRQLIINKKEIESCYIFNKIKRIDLKNALYLFYWVYNVKIKLSESGQFLIDVDRGQ